MIAAEQTHLVGPVYLAANRTVAGSSCYMHCVVVGPMYSKKKIDLVQTTTSQIGVVVGLEFADLGSLRKGSEPMQPAD